MVKIRPFSPAFPLADFMAEAFFRLFHWNFKEKGISHFLWHSLSFYRGQPSSESEPPAGRLHYSLWLDDLEAQSGGGVHGDM